MFGSLFGSKKKSLFILGYGLDVSNEAEFQDVLATQICTESLAHNAPFVLELIFKNDRLVQTVNWEEGEEMGRNDVPEHMKFSYTPFTPNTVHLLEFNPKGIHSLGGDIPEHFLLPKTNAVVPFQYLGCIRNHDPLFSWLPNDLHLACPIFLNFDKCFVDYCDPFKPVVINASDLEQCDTSHDDLNQRSEIIYKEKKFSFVHRNYFANDGHAGIPEWVQYPDIPHCPVSGQRMKFVCQLEGGVSAAKSNVVLKDKNFAPYFKQLNFWGDGILYVFFEPETKTACYLIQNT